MTIYNARPEVFVDENLNRPIRVYTSTTGEEKFIGVTSIQADPRMQPMEIPFEIEAKDIYEAYDKYDEAADVEFKRMEGEIKTAQNKIVTPNKDIVI